MFKRIVFFLIILSLSLYAQSQITISKPKPAKYYIEIKNGVFQKIIVSDSVLVDTTKIIVEKNVNNIKNRDSSKISIIFDGGIWNVSNGDIAKLLSIKYETPKIDSVYITPK